MLVLTIERYAYGGVADKWQYTDSGARLFVDSHFSPELRHVPEGADHWAHHHSARVSEAIGLITHYLISTRQPLQPGAAGLGPTTGRTTTAPG